MKVFYENIHVFKFMEKYYNIINKVLFLINLYFVAYKKREKIRSLSRLRSGVKRAFDNYNYK